jgi:catechol 2,3-dioxygenase-like lactoylglutathione lyase family enzyme
MPSPNLMILYVDNPPASADFYHRLLGLDPVESTPTFVMFALPSGLMLGLWSRHTCEPTATTAGGGAELAMKVDNFAAVDALHTDWRSRGLSILQPPTDMDFGRTFVALDPDKHRLRVYAMAQNAR